MMIFLEQLILVIYINELIQIDAWKRESVKLEKKALVLIVKSIE